MAVYAPRGRTILSVSLWEVLPFHSLDWLSEVSTTAFNIALSSRFRCAGYMTASRTSTNLSILWA